MTKKLLAFTATSIFLTSAALAQESAQHAAGGHSEGAQPGLLDLNLSSIVWVLVIFTLLAVILYQKAWKNVLGGLKAREQRIRNDIAEAEAARAKAESVLRDYNQQLAGAEARAQALIAKASADAEALAAQIRARGQQEAEEARERATKEIVAAKQQAIREIHEQAADLATSAAEKIIRRSLNPNDYRDLVNQSLEQLQTMGR